MFNLFFSLFAGVLFAALWSIALSGFSIAPWVPAKKRDMERINRLSELKPGQLFIELGCGDGRVCRYIAKRNPEVRVVGIEISFPMFLWSKISGFFCRLHNMEIKLGNALRQDLKNADVVYVFGVINSMNNKLKKKFEKEMKPGARVISYIFSIKEWGGKHVCDKPEKKGATINVYYL